VDSQQEGGQPINEIQQVTQENRRHQMGNEMRGDTRMNGKKAWTTPVMGTIQLNSARTGGAISEADSKTTTRKS
jgi:hypothetical protein